MSRICFVDNNGENLCHGLMMKDMKWKVSNDFVIYDVANAHCIILI